MVQPMTDKYIVATRISVEWNDNPKMVRLDAEMPNELQELFDQWLSDIEHEINSNARK